MKRWYVSAFLLISVSTALFSVEERYVPDMHLILSGQHEQGLLVCAKAARNTLERRAARALLAAVYMTQAGSIRVLSTGRTNVKRNWQDRLPLNGVVAPAISAIHALQEKRTFKVTSVQGVLGVLWQETKFDVDQFGQLSNAMVECALRGFWAEMDGNASQACRWYESAVRQAAQYPNARKGVDRMLEWFKKKQQSEQGHVAE